MTTNVIFFLYHKYNINDSQRQIHKRRYIAGIFLTLFIYNVTSFVIILICIVITLVIYQNYIMTLFHDDDVIYDIKTFIKRVKENVNERALASLITYSWMSLIKVYVI